MLCWDEELLAREMWAGWAPPGLTGDVQVWGWCGGAGQLAEVLMSLEEGMG